MHGERWSGRFRAFASGSVTVICLLVGTVIGGVLGTGTAHADAFRYWGFYQAEDGGWAFSQKGPADVTPKDGDVDGWRYAIAGDSTGERVPRTDVTFDELCGDTPAEAGTKRVGIVLDFGLAAEAPDGDQPQPARGECAVVDENATSAQVLAEVAEVREDKGLVCAIDAFPSSGCGEPVKDEPKVPNPEPTVELELPDAAPADDPADDPAEDPAEDPADNAAGNEQAKSGDAEAAAEADGGFPVLPVVGGAIVVLLVAGGIWQYNRRRGSDAS